MFKKNLLGLALSALSLGAQAHQLWLEQDASGPVRVYVGDADDHPDGGEDIAKLVATTRILLPGGKNAQGPMKVTQDHLEAAGTPAGDVRATNDQVFKPWKTKDGQTKAAIFSARAGRSETKAGLDYEFVPVSANGKVFNVTFRGQVLADKRVTVVSPDKWTMTLKTDASGRVEVPLREKGRYILISNHDADPVGDVEIADQKIQKLGYVTTLSFVVR